MIQTIPIQNIYYILCYAWGMGDMCGKVNVGTEDCVSVSNLLVHVLLNATDNLLKRGMNQGYIVFADELDGIKGKINIAETLKQGRYRQGKAYCNFDGLSSDILINQIIASTLLDSLQIAELSEQNRVRIAKTLRRMPKTRRIHICDHVFRSVRIHRNNRYYQFALNVCKLLYHSTLPNKNSDGKFEFTDVLDDEKVMNRIFEKFLLNFYKQVCKHDFSEVSHSHIRFQLTPRGMTFATSTDEAYALLPLMETDVTIFNPQTKKKIILDAKYYKETLVSRFGERGKIRRDHLSQILTYVMNQESESKPHTKETQGILIYPTVDTEVDASYAYKDTKHIIRVSTINLNQNWRLIEQRLKEIIA